MQTRTITLYEHGFCPYREIGLSADDPIFLQIDQLNEKAGKEIITLTRKGIQANELVGMLRVGSLTFQVLPKIDWPGGIEDQPGRSQSAMLNLFFLLSYAYDLRLYQPDLALLSSRHGSWYEFLTFLFASELHRQVQRGFAQSYIHMEETLPVIRGRWNLNQQIGRHAFVRDRFDVTFDSFSPDIRLNRILRFVVERLRQTTADVRNLNLLADLSAWMEPVTLLSDLAVSELDQVHFNRLNERFQPAFQFARLFLSMQAVSLQSGHTNSFAFVLDMNLLFERFVARFLVRHRDALMPSKWENIQITPQAQGMGVYLAQRVTSGRPLPVAHLKPDLLFHQAGFTRPCLVMDTKYKRLDPNARRLGVSEGDLYQMLAYHTRFECLQVVLLYPQPDAGTPIHDLFILDPDRARVWIHTINLHQPLTSAQVLFPEFKRIFQSLITD